MNQLRKRLVAGAALALATLLGPSAARADVALFLRDIGTGQTQFYSSPGDTLMLTGVTIGNFIITEATVVGDTTGSLSQAEAGVSNTSGSPDTLQLFASVINVSAGSGTVQMLNSGSVTFAKPNDFYDTQAAIGVGPNNVLYQGGFVDFIGTPQGFVSSPGDLSFGGTTTDTFQGVTSPFMLTNVNVIGLNAGHHAVGAGAFTTVAAVPEPSTVALALAGALPLGLAAMRRRKAA